MNFSWTKRGVTELCGTVGRLVRALEQRRPTSPGAAGRSVPHTYGAYLVATTAIAKLSPAEPGCAEVQVNARAQVCQSGTVLILTRCHQ
jgi:hypothetical protein